jgi:uncharacterized protein with GYD domain
MVMAEGEMVLGTVAMALVAEAKAPAAVVMVAVVVGGKGSVKAQVQQ